MLTPCGHAASWLVTQRRATAAHTDLDTRFETRISMMVRTRCPQTCEQRNTEAKRTSASRTECNYCCCCCSVRGYRIITTCLRITRMLAPMMK